MIGHAETLELDIDESSGFSELEMVFDAFGNLVTTPDDGRPELTTRRIIII